MKKSWIILSAVCALMVAAPFVAFAGDGDNPHRGPRGDREMRGPRADADGPRHGFGMLLEAGATEEQVSKMRDLGHRLHLEAVDIEAAVKKAEMTFHHLLAGDEFDEAALHAAIDAVGKARTALDKHKATGIVKMREILGADLWKKVKAQVIRHAFARDAAPRGMGERPEVDRPAPRDRGEDGPRHHERDGDERGGHGR